MNKKILPFTVSIAALMFLGAGCVSFSSSGASNLASDGGIFKSVNKGDNWAQKTAVPTVNGTRATINGVSVTAIIQDPQDANAFYIGTVDNGMFYTYDAGESWLQPPL